MISVKARAKVNLFLEVTARRSDGFHELATVFARIGLCDTLRLSRARRPGIKLKLEGGRVGGAPGENIVYKAAEKFFREFGIKPAVSITLRKRVPVGAGLGGGSSDAAAALRGLCRLYRLDLPASGGRLMKLAAELGSDVPFFLLDSPAASATGRGEKLTPLAIRGRKPGLVLVYPGEPVLTKEAYGALRLAPRREILRRVSDFRRFRAGLAKTGLTAAAGRLMFNRLEDPVLPRHPAVAEAREKLAAAGASPALMSGSGATVFGLFPDASSAAKAARSLARNRGYRVFRTKIC